MIRFSTCAAVASFLFSTAAFAGGPHPCAEIVNACKAAHFVNREAKDGTGLWADCVRPIMQGKPQPANAKLPVPSVSADTIAACKAKRPNFGEK